MQGLTFAEIARRVGADQPTPAGRRDRECLASALRDEERRGRLRREGERYVLVPGAFAPDLVAALRALAPPPAPARESNGRRSPVRREPAGRIAASWPDHARAEGSIPGTRGAERRPR